MNKEHDTRYSFTETEARIYRMWEEKNCFRARGKGESYVIAIPPPNVTGRLHMGHALNNLIQDMLIRYKRMDGFDALWVPGTDHAGIATQTVVKKMLDEHGVDYRELGREKFIAKVWEWKEKYGGMILDQLKRIGASCDWERTRFTMDEGMSRAVVHAFKKLYDDGLIYRGERIVNWCPVDKTALSDDEVETKEGGEPGFLWQMKYPLEDGSGHLTVATTRPETLFGDMAVAVNPGDKRYKNIIGKNVIVPLQERVVPVIADAYVDMEFGTGCLKITPAHDPNDFEIGARHKLRPVNVMNEDATMNGVVPRQFQGLDRFECRKKAVAELQSLGLLVKEEERMTPLGRSYRSGAVIEYRLSKQWFVKMKPLAERVLKLHERLNIQPPRWNKVYLDWLNNIRDWCISRQIWWGHRIPVWYCAGEGTPPLHITVSEAPPKKCPRCGSTDLKQDEDVLDTWFSSALWPMSTLGWPEKTPDFKRYFPTTTLVTAKDIIFFWVARMNMMAAYFTDKLPYQDVYINPTVLDEKGETMSKSKGNGIDPLVIVNGATLQELEGPVREARPANMKEILKRLEKNFQNGYEGVGADALRYTLIYLCSSGQQLKISLNTFHDLGRRFMTKLWNVARFILMYVEQEKEKGGDVPADFESHLVDEDLWIRARAQLAANRVRECLDGYDFTNLGQTYYQYMWNDFCDWYVELAKVRLTGPDAAQRKAALHNLCVVFSQMLILLHPLIPFITEELWNRLLPLVEGLNLWGGRKPASRILMQADFPKHRPLNAGEESLLKQFGKLQDMVSAIRTLRKAYRIKDAEDIAAYLLPLDKIARRIADGSSPLVCRLAHLASLQKLSVKKDKPPRVITILDPSFEVYLDIASFIDVAQEKKRLTREIEGLKKQVESLNKRLQNISFLENARPEVVEEQKSALKNHQDQLNRLDHLYREISGW